MASFAERCTNLQTHLEGCTAGVKTQISYAKEGGGAAFKKIDMTLRRPFFLP